MVCDTVWRAKDKEVQDTPMPALMPGVEIILDIALQKTSQKVNMTREQKVTGKEIDLLYPFFFFTRTSFVSDV